MKKLDQSKDDERAVPAQMAKQQEKLQNQATSHHILGLENQRLLKKKEVKMARLAELESDKKATELRE